MIIYVVKINPVPIRSFYRSVSNHEYHYNEKRLNDIGHRLAARLLDEGVNAVSAVSSFPMEMEQQSPQKWIVSHKPIAVEAGLGQIGKNRLVLHPIYGSYTLINAILIDFEISKYDQPVENNPCINCNLCVSACPTGSIGKDERFNFIGCFNHNYRDQQGGFLDLLNNLSEGSNAKEFNNKFKDYESMGIWQNITYGANYKCTYCVAVCPAGKNNIGSFTSDKKGFVHNVIKPLQDKEEFVYVLNNSDAHDYVKDNFPHKTVTLVKNGMRLHSIKEFFEGLPLVFQRQKADGVNNIYQKNNSLSMPQLLSFLIFIFAGL